ncbi:MAG: TaqI-like C-terminal specificity domain-containing protein [Sediminibacterium sp.]|nr:TaqI-like C-terminal specificity domain-containing protein [Sediminibacterium sp.]MDP3127672.1 TaqI-like C-terminal specificity domain-containing protein [Sediminibacterium sp.]
MVEKESDKLIQIEEAIQSFNNKELYESSLTFFKSLDYQSNKTAQLSSTNYDGFIDSFNLSKNAINKDKALVSHWKYIEFIFQVADSEITRVQSLFDTGEVDSNEYQSFLFFTLQLKEDNYKRGDLVKITRELNVPFKMPVIVLFNYGNKLTLSIIDRRLHKNDTSKDVLEKVTLIKDIDIANPQRAHKEILKDLSLSELYKKFEFHSFLKLHEAWKATLNISELNKKFYKELAYWYFWALQEVKFPDDELKDDKTRNPVNVIRLITRLIFVWFLKEKNLIPDDLFNKRELDKILEYKDKTGSTYYKAILQNLFFATLNTEMNKDVKDKNKISRSFVNRNTGVPHYFRYSRFIKDQEKFAKWMDNIPFLNGGLFECLDKRTKDKDIFIDGFTQQLKNESTLKVPDYLFFSEAPRNIDLNNTFHTKGKKYEVRGLIDILSRYKFTIEENTPVEEEVALDPELLGKVFENLLASYIEETETTARKLTGSFYTPREIVNYMVDESLISYLCNSLLKDDDENKREELNERLHHLFSYTAEEPQFTDAERKELIDAIDNCKILDPACGSGAFPMGILHKLVFILSKLDPNNKKWKQKQQDKAKRDMVLAEKMEDDKNRDAAIKEIDLRIKDIDRAFNQNNHELDFARKLYLIENCIYGVDKQPVAIQISKLRFFIALIVDQKTENNSEPNRGIRPLPNLETKFVAADSLKWLEKEHTTLFTNPEIDIKKNKLKKIRADHFRARTPNGKESLRIKDEELRNELSNLLVLNNELQPATAKKIANWNPYDQNTYADFFDTEWMFEIENGFHIIIGNPPYLRVQGLSKADKYYFKEHYIAATGAYDLYCLFTERGFNLLNKNGILNFIQPDKWINGSLGKGLRKVTKNHINKLISFKEYQVFNASTYSSLLWITKQNQTHFTYYELNRDLPSNNDLHEWLNSKEDIDFVRYKNASLPEDAWTFTNNEAVKILDILNKKPRKVKDVFDRVFTGLQTSLDKVYFINDAIKKKGLVTGFSDALGEEVTIEEGFLKPILKGEHVHRYKPLKTNVYVIFPYKLSISQDNETAVPMQPDFIKKNFPLGWEYISKCKKQINGRESGKIANEKDWYKYIYPKNLTLFSKARLICPDICSHSQFTYDKKGDFACTTTLYGYLLFPEVKESYEFYLGILNSNVLWYFMKNTSAVLANGYYRYMPRYVNEFSLPNADKTEQNIIEYFSSALLLLNLNIDENLISYEFEKVLNGCVYELYFGVEMKKAEVDILALVKKDLETIKNLSSEIGMIQLYNKWREPQNEVRNRLLLMATRCPETIGIIEANA